MTYDLQRFKDAHERDYSTALAEVREFVDCANATGHHTLDTATLEEIVRTDGKGRYSLDGTTRASAPTRATPFSWTGAFGRRRAQASAWVTTGSRCPCAHSLRV